MSVCKLTFKLKVCVNFFFLLLPLSVTCSYTVDFNCSNTDGLLTMAVSNLFSSPLEYVP